MTTQEAILLGAAGGLVPDLIRVVRARHESRPPDFLKFWWFYLSVILLAGLGGFCAWILQAATVKDALIYGFSAPEVLSNLAGAVATGKTEAQREAQRGEVEAVAPATGLLSWWVK